jgi:hypothetical protein
MTHQDVLRHAIEQLLEDVSLTADLIDDAAKLLLEWGVSQISAVTQQAEGLSSEDLGARLADLRRTLRRINKEAGQAAPEEQAAQVQVLLSKVSPAEQEPEVDEWCTSAKDRYHLS